MRRCGRTTAASQTGTAKRRAEGREPAASDAVVDGLRLGVAYTDKLARRTEAVHRVWQAIEQHAVSQMYDQVDMPDVCC